MLFYYIKNGILKTTRGTLKRQGRPSRGAPTPPGYRYLTHHLPQKVTLVRIKRFCYRRTSPNAQNKRKENTALYSDTKNVLASAAARNICILKTNCSYRLRCRQGEEQHPRRHSHPRQNLARPQTATRAEGSPPQKRKPTPRLGPRQPRQASRPWLRWPPLHRVSSTERELGLHLVPI